MKYFTLSEAAAEMHLHRIRIWQLIHAGRIKAHRKGQNWLIAEEDLAAFAAIRRGRHVPIPKPPKIIEPMCVCPHPVRRHDEYGCQDCRCWRTAEDALAAGGMKKDPSALPGPLKGGKVLKVSCGGGLGIAPARPDRR